MIPILKYCLEISIIASIISVIFIVIFTLITKLSKKTYFIIAISVLSVIALLLIPVFLHLSSIYYLQFMNKSVNTFFEDISMYLIPGLILCFLNPLIIKISTDIVAKIKNDQLHSEDNCESTDIKKAGDM